ncbi:MAG TPA: hypothetical protein VD908_09605 [Cytophagales bacterium]|nr:hypothetical protein [Cytophagales bacterium]
MKKIYLKFIPLVFVGGLVLTSCNKEDDIKKEDPITEVPTEFSEKSVAENKEELENNGIEMVSTMTELKSTASVKGAISFSHFIEELLMDSEENQRKILSHKGIALMQLLASFGKDKTSSTKVLSGMRVTEDDSTIQGMYNQSIGVYAWQDTAWTYTETGDKIVFQFPSTSTGTTNNASFTISNYKGVSNSNLLMDDYYGDYPESVMAELVIDGNKEMEYSFTAKYNSNGEPTSVTTSLTLSPFKLSASASNSTTEIKADYSLNKGDKVLLAFGGQANGNFDSNNIDASEDAGDVVETSKAYFQILNIKFTGELNVKGLYPSIDDESLSTEEEVALLNEHYKLVASYADSNEKIADTEFYAATRTYEVEKDCHWDQNNEWVCSYEDVTENNAEIRLIFADDTKADLETYTNEGFEDIQTKFEDFTDGLEEDLD